MKKTKILLGLSFAGILGLTLIAADHVDATAVTNTKSDITDLYAFQGSNTNNLVFVANLQAADPIGRDRPRLDDFFVHFGTDPFQGPQRVGLDLDRSPVRCIL